MGVNPGDSGWVETEKGSPPSLTLAAVHMLFSKWALSNPQAAAFYREAGETMSHPVTGSGAQACAQAASGLGFSLPRRSLETPEGVHTYVSPQPRSQHSPLRPPRAPGPELSVLDGTSVSFSCQAASNQTVSLQSSPLHKVSQLPSHFILILLLDLLSLQQNPAPCLCLPSLPLGAQFLPLLPY